MNENGDQTIFEKKEESAQSKGSLENLQIIDSTVEDNQLNGAKASLHETKDISIAYQNRKNFSVAPDILRLFVKNGEYVYARPNDIVMIESCDHLVKVYLAYDNKYKKTIRSSTLKDFLLQLPEKQFLRIGRFCAVNSKRLSGGNYNEQSFEFDFRISIKLKHAISHTLFNAIGK